MTVQECYIQMKANYEGVHSRLGTDTLIEKFLHKFINDSTYNNLCDAFIKKDADAAFLASHTLKGVSMNLGFTSLEKTTNKLTEQLRDKYIGENSYSLFLEVQEAYKNTVDAINEYENKKLK